GKEKELTFEDAIGKAVTVHKPVTRVVTLPPSSLDTIRAIGANDKVVGVSTYLDKVYFPELSKLPSVGSSWSRPDYEAIIELEPDIVLTLGSYNPGIEDKIGPAGIAVVRMEFNRVDLLPEEIRKLGYIIDRENDAEEFANWYEGWTNEIISRTDELSENEKPQVYMGYWNKAGGKGTLWDAACIMAGGINIAGGIDGYCEVDHEWVIEQNPNVIVKAVTSSEASQGYREDDPIQMKEARERIMSQVGWENTNAVKSGRVYVSAWQLHLGTHTVILIAYMAKWIHPELFEDLDPQAIHQGYLTRFQHLDYNLDEHGVFVYPPLED
ncbi:MAG: ABC transporter substrate-binding protein, partial [Methanophagales archaeon]|nr:ABC transporter substrate-binding protein [Methanophagales archaeon]